MLSLTLCPAGGAGHVRGAGARPSQRGGGGAAAGRVRGALAGRPAAVRRAQRVGPPLRARPARPSGGAAQLSKWSVGRPEGWRTSRSSNSPLFAWHWALSQRLTLSHQSRRTHLPGPLQEVPHSSGHVLQLATPDGQEQVEVPDPFPPPPGSHLPLAAPVQPGSCGSSSSGAQPAAAAAATVPLLLRQVGAAATAADGTAALRVAAAAAPSGCSVEVHVLGGSKAAAAGLQQPGLLPGSSALHRFALQVRAGAGAVF